MQCYSPYLLYSKKRYAGLMYTSPDKADYVDIKGLQLVRRDSIPLVREVSNAILDAIMHDRDPHKAVGEAKACIMRVLRGEEPLEKFIVSKTLRSDYKNKSQPHLIVANKILRRTGARTHSGAMVPYVFVEDEGNQDALQAERAEDPEYVRANNLKIDVLQYITSQLENPITSLLDVLVDDPANEVFGDENVAPLLHALRTQQAAWIKEAKRVRKNVAAGQKEITAYFTK